jgi:hypothetical protein
MNYIPQEYFWLMQAVFICLCSMMFPIVMGFGFNKKKLLVMCLVLTNVILLIAIVNESNLYIPSLIGLGLGLLWHADLNMPKSNNKM